MEKVKVIWLKPIKEKISIGRQLIAKKLEKEGFEVSIIECSVLNIFKVLLYSLTSDFDIIIGTTHLGLVIGGILKFLTRKPFLADFVDEFHQLKIVTPFPLYPIMYAIILLEKISLKVADAVIVTPRDFFKEISRKRKNVYKINLCVDLKKFLYTESAAINKARGLLRKTGIDLSKPIIVYIGGFSKIYNLHILIEAMEHLPEFQLIMVGGGKLESELKKLRDEKKLSNVFFIGYQPNEIVAGILKISNVGVTLAEVPRQLKIYEYIASGLSIVVPEKILKDEEFEFRKYCIGTKPNPVDLAEKIRMCINKRKKVPIFSRKINKYDCDVVSLKYALILKHILDSR